VEREILVPIRRIADIHVGDRHRRDLGDIPGLAGNGGDALGVLTEADSIL
jgi:hypothetical protein